MNSANTHVDIDSMLREPGHELLKAALDLAGRGQPVFPVKPGEKRPLTRHGVKDATTDARQITAWWTQHPDANIGLACGRSAGIYVVDCDTDKATGETIGENAFRAACAAIGFDIDTTLTVRTPSGGRHFYFQHPATDEPLKNSVRFLDGCDTRSEGGYVLAPPSRTAAGRSYYPENELEPQPMPPALVDLFRGVKNPQEPATKARRRPKGRNSYAEKAIQELVNEVSLAPEGARNDTLNRCSLRAFRIALAAGSALDGVADDLHAAARSAGLDDIEASRTIGSARKAAREMGPADIPEKEKPGRRTSSRPSRPQRPPEMDADAAEDLAELDALLAAADDGHVGPAQMFVERFRDRYLFDRTAREWYQFEGGCWRPEELGDVAEDMEAVRAAFARGADRCAQLALEQPITQEAQTYWRDSEATLRKARKALTLNHNIKAVVEIAGTGSGNLTYDGRGWDTESHALPCANGVVDLRPENGHLGRLRPGRPSDRFLKRAPTRYDAKAECPRFREALAQIFSEEHLPDEKDREMCGFMKRLMGYSVLRAPREQIFCFMVGAGSNGKSLLMELFDHVLGPLAGNVKKEVFLRVRDKDANAPSPSNFAFRGVGPCFCRELDGSQPFDIGLVKALTGNDPITARNLYAAREITFQPSHTLMISTNELPHLPVLDDATWRRVLKICFKRAFKDNPNAEKGELPKDRNLLATLKEEAEGILAWIVAGAIEYLEHGLQVPDSVYAETKAYRESLDTIARFVDDCCHVADGARARAGEMYTAYKTWCQDGGIRNPMTEENFKKNMVAHGFEWKRTGDGRIYKGIGLLAS